MHCNEMTDKAQLLAHNRPQNEFESHFQPQNEEKDEALYI